MGIVREPDGVEFVVTSGRWSPDESAEAAIWLAGYRQGRSAALSPAELADAVMKLPTKERTQLIRRLTTSASSKLPTNAPRRRTKREKAHVG